MFVAAGHFRAGIQLSIGTAEMVRDLITGQPAGRPARCLPAGPRAGLDGPTGVPVVTRSHFRVCRPPGSLLDNGGMDPHDHRAKVRQLADDLGWLEDHCRRQPELAVHAAHLRLAAALTRNVVGPAVEGQPARPLFVAVVGGAGAGKSTVVNFLVGSAVAEANPQAGYTRHPTAYLPAASGVPWPSYLGFLGPLQRLSPAAAGQPRRGRVPGPASPADRAGPTRSPTSSSGTART